ncbi:MAG: hypothetical protein QM598_01330 [Protaetiibacter sp.]
MRGLLLFARSRRWGLNVLVSLASGAAMVACGPLSYELNPRGGYLIAVSAQIALLPAVVIAASLATSLREQESQAARYLPKWRFLHVALLSLVAAGTAALAATQLAPPPDALVNAYAALGPLAFARNVFALTGSALVFSAIAGPSFGWILPLGWAILPFLALPSLDADTTGILTLVMQPDDAFLPFIASLAVWGTGALLAARNWSISNALSGLAP